MRDRKRSNGGSLEGNAAAEKPFNDIYDGIHAQLLSHRKKVTRQKKGTPAPLRHRFFLRFPTIVRQARPEGSFTRDHPPTHTGPIRARKRRIGGEETVGAGKGRIQSLALGYTSRPNASPRGISRFLRRDRFRFLCEHVHEKS